MLKGGDVKYFDKEFVDLPVWALSRCTRVATCVNGPHHDETYPTIFSVVNNKLPGKTQFVPLTDDYRL